MRECSGRTRTRVRPTGSRNAPTALQLSQAGTGLDIVCAGGEHSRSDGVPRHPQGPLLSAMWALAKANLFWVLHAGRVHMPGRIDPPRMFTSYWTDAVLLHPRRRMVSKRKA
eukprot:1929668-Pleurochrysis_carterae.AAC.1